MSRSSLHERTPGAARTRQLPSDSSMTDEHMGSKQAPSLVDRLPESTDRWQIELLSRTCFAFSAKDQTTLACSLMIFVYYLWLGLGECILAK